ncbi:MAG: cytochrome-c peroxidase [Flavobacteriales bacterium]|nr:cytochrome-c peroxidase [Flavobacteriales bacterium]
MNNLRKGVFFLIAISVLASCKDKDAMITDDITSNPTEQEIISKYLTIDLSSLDEYIELNYPIHYNDAVLSNDNSLINNPVTNVGATLGRVLFYDKNLSVNNTVACASCHVQNKGFTDDKKLSIGFEGGETGAHSMRLLNTRFYAGNNMFWNKRSTSVENQSTQPIKDAVEMGFDSIHGGFDNLISKMKGLEYYPILFKRAFGNEEITETKVQRAIAQFVRSIVSINSKFDEGFAQVYNATAPGNNVGQPFPNFTQQENMGKNLFLAPPNAPGGGGAGCAGCHNPPTFALAANSLSNGLDAGETTIFKSPSLKNIGVVGPYMHDGRFATLAEVVKHYSTEVQPGPALDNRLNPNGTPQRLNLNQNQIDALVAFMQTLTDNIVMQDKKFSDPFR